MTPEEVSDLRRWFEKSDGIADGRPFLGDRRMDAMIDVMLEMSAQLWVLKRRNSVLEAVLVESGRLSPDAVEQHTLSPETASALRSEGKDFVATIFRSFSELSMAPTPIPSQRNDDDDRNS